MRVFEHVGRAKNQIRPICDVVTKKICPALFVSSEFSECVGTVPTSQAARGARARRVRDGREGEASIHNSQLLVVLAVAFTFTA